MTRWLLLATLPLWACSESQGIRLSFPSESESVVVVLSEGSQVLQLLARDQLGPPTARQLLFEAPTGTAPDQIELLSYDQPLSSLALPSGPLPQGGLDDRALPAESARFRAHLEGTVPSEWVEVAEGTRYTVNLPAPNPCVPLESQALVLPETADETMQAVFLLDQDRALISTSRGRYFEVRADGTVLPRSELSTSTPHLAAFRDPGSGELTMVDSDGSIWRGPLEGLRQERAPDRVLLGPLDKAGVDGSGPERWAVTTAISWLYFNGQSWTSLFQAEPEQHEPVAVLALGPGEALATGLHGGLVQRFVNGQIRDEPFSVDDFDQGSVLYQDARFGLFLGTIFGQVMRYLDNRWQPVPEATPFGLTVAAMAPLGDGVYIASTEGVGALYFPEHGFCEVARRAPGVTEWMVPLGDQVLALSRKCCGQTGDENATLIRIIR